MVEAPLHPYCLGETDGGGSGKKSLARPPTDGTEHCRAGTSLGTPPKEEEEEEWGEGGRQPAPRGPAPAPSPHPGVGSTGTTPPAPRAPPPHLPGVGFGLGRLEEGVGQLPQPHGQRVRHVGPLGVHDGVEERLQVGLRVAPHMDDLVARRRRTPPGGLSPAARGPPRRRHHHGSGGLRGSLLRGRGLRCRRRLLLLGLLRWGLPGIHGSGGTPRR